jgi:hypothetical protein
MSLYIFGPCSCPSQAVASTHANANANANAYANANANVSAILRPALLFENQCTKMPTLVFFLVPTKARTRDSVS